MRTEDAAIQALERRDAPARSLRLKKGPFT
jgi:hypothetical protein